MMAGYLDHVQLLQNINQKLQHENDYFTCFKEDFENITFVWQQYKNEIEGLLH